VIAPRLPDKIEHARPKGGGLLQQSFFGLLPSATAETLRHGSFCRSTVAA